LKGWHGLCEVCFYLSLRRVQAPFLVTFKIIAGCRRYDVHPELSVQNLLEIETFSWSSHRFRVAWTLDWASPPCARKDRFLMNPIYHLSGP